MEGKQQEAMRCGIFGSGRRRGQAARAAWAVKGPMQQLAEPRAARFQPQSWSCEGSSQRSLPGGSSAVGPPLRLQEFPDVFQALIRFLRGELARDQAAKGLGLTPVFASRLFAAPNGGQAASPARNLKGKTYRSLGTCAAACWPCDRRPCRRRRCASVADL